MLGFSGYMAACASRVRLTLVENNRPRDVLRAEKYCCEGIVFLLVTNGTNKFLGESFLQTIVMDGLEDMDTCE